MITFLAIFLALIFLSLLLLYLGLVKIVLGILFFVVLALLISIFFFALEAYRVIFLGNAPFVTSKQKMIKKILQEIDFKSQSKVYELGCGDARFLRELARRKNIQAIGYEYFMVPYLLARFYNLFAKNKVKVYFKDFFKVNLSDADYIFCYLMTEEMARLEEKLKQELKPGALVISNTFTFKNWQPEKTIIIDENKRYSLSNKLYIYRR